MADDRLEERTGAAQAADRDAHLMNRFDAGLPSSSRFAVRCPRQPPTMR